MVSPIALVRYRDIRLANECRRFAVVETLAPLQLHFWNWLMELRIGAMLIYQKYDFEGSLSGRSMKIILLIWALSKIFSHTSRKLKT